ncbi:MAG: hypothetical protein AAGG65_05565 [Pseudomonadota bacterium]
MRAKSGLLGLAIILVGLGGLVSPAQAQDWEPEERLIVPIPDGWAPAGTDTPPTGRLTVYLSAMNPSEDQIGVQRFFGIGDQAPSDVATRMLQGLPETCAPEDADLATPPARNGRALAIASIVCRPQTEDGGETGLIEVSRALVLSGDQDLHMVTRVWQGAEGTEDDPTGGNGAAAAWTRFFDSITYCEADGC